MNEFIEKIVYVYGPVLLMGYYIRQIILPPVNFPKNIPTIPFYVTMLSLFTNLDQQDIYDRFLKEKLEKYGAVKIYFGSRWNILVSKPNLLVQIFQNENKFAKSGNHIKIPYAILSDYTGDNLISSHGSNWRLYREVLTNAIQFPNLEPVVENSQRFIDLLLEKTKVSQTIFMGDVIQRYSLANIMECMFGLNLQLFTNSQSILHEKLKYVKAQIFKPIYLTFPFLDLLVPSRFKTRKEVAAFKEYFCDTIKTQSGNGKVSKKLLEALKDGTFTEKQFTDNAMIVMIAGHENPQLFLSSLLYVLAKNPIIQNRLRDELGNINFETSRLEDCVYLSGVICETLRLYPSLGQIINRCTSETVTLGDMIIPKGVYVGYNNFATGRDKTVWDQPEIFQPERWGSTIDEVNRNYAKAKSSARLPAFHGRKRACLGEKFALYELKQLLAQILKVYMFELDPDWQDKLTPSGPISPLGLKLKFNLI